MPSSTAYTYRVTDYLLGILILLLSGLGLFWTAHYLKPVHLPPASPGSYHLIAQLDDLAPGSALSFELEGKQWLLVSTGGDISAVSAYCTYRTSQVRWDAANRVFQCQGHGCTFDHRGGLIHGLATAPLESLRIRIMDGLIYGARNRA